MSGRGPQRLLLRVLQGAGRRLVLKAAPRLGLTAYDPSWDFPADLDKLAEYSTSAAHVLDSRATTVEDGGARDLTITVDGLANVIGDRFHGARVLEVGPKYGIHSLWLDKQLEPSELVFSDFASDRPLHDTWKNELRSPHRFVYGDLRSAAELAELEPFDLVLFLGVLYHSVYHLPLLSMLNRVTRLGGTMLLETTYDRRPDASVRLRWPEKNRKAKAVPTVSALRLMLAWTGWRRVTRYSDYRPGSSELLLECEKTDEIAGDESDFSELVVPQRPPVGLPASP
jgi:SAM-dependent methyltransferase